MEDQNSISIINRGNGSLTGEKAQALPIKLITGISWLKFILIGFVLAIVIFVIFLFNSQKQVAVVQVTGKADSFKILQLN